jgi:hypothetical protein
MHRDHGSSLSQGFSTVPFPSKAMSAFVAADPRASEDVSSAFRTFRTRHVPWMVVLPWWLSQEAVSPLLRQRAIAPRFHADLQRVLRGSDTDFSLALLQQDPKMFSDLVASLPRDLVPQYLVLGLSVPDPAPLMDKLSAEQLRSGLAEAMSSPEVCASLWGAGPQVVDPRPLWRRWTQALETLPALREAWQSLADEHEQLRQHAKDWLACWLPSGKWEGSPLQQWTKSPDRATSPATSPVWETALSDMANTVPPARLASHLAKHFFNVTASNQVDAFCSLPLAFIQAYDDAFPGMARPRLERPYRVLPCVPGLLSVGLYCKSQWGERVGLGNEAAIADMQEALSDPRVCSPYLSGLSQSGLQSWLYQRPQWLQWRDQQGNTLLQRWVDVAPERASYTLLAKLQARWPQYVANANHEGVCLLDNASLLSESHRKRLIARGLKSAAKQAQPPGPRPSPAKRKI